MKTLIAATTIAILGTVGIATANDIEGGVLYMPEADTSAVYLNFDHMATDNLEFSLDNIFTDDEVLTSDFRLTYGTTANTEVYGGALVVDGDVEPYVGLGFKF